MRVCAFVGPSLPPGDRVHQAGFVYLRPASRGDVERAADEYDAIVLVDGVFHHDLAPSPKEVLDACRRVTVLGAASMGALRAAECAVYGAVPLGIIARWYLREIIDGDDEVAVLMHPETHVALSVPSVNVRYVARIAQRRGLLTREQAAGWIDSARTQIFYTERTWEAAVAFAPAVVRGQLREMGEREGDLKRLDAIFAIRRALRMLGSGARAAV